MGSLGGSVVRTVDSRGIVNGSSVINQINNRGLPTATSGNNLSLSSSISSPLSHNQNSYFMANSVQTSQSRSMNEILRHIPNLSGRQSNNFIGRPYTGSSSGQTVVGLGSSFNDPAPSPLDLSEFPSLTSRGADSSQTNSMPTVGRQAYVGMVKQPTSETSEFTMSNEDFPALPGSQIATSKSETFSTLTDKKSTSMSDPIIDMNHSRVSEKSQKRGIQTTPEGKVTCIPSNMVTDQFGMVGLLMFIRAAESDSNLVSLAQGTDLTTLGLNLNSPDNLYPNFGGPWAETPCRPQDIDYHVPQEYLTNQVIRGKLAPVKFERYCEDLLFYMFYSNVGDKLQIQAAQELYGRDWRFHKEERVWITRAPGMNPAEKTSLYERGTYLYFDAQNWRKIPKEFHLEYDKLEDMPSLPATTAIGLNASMSATQ